MESVRQIRYYLFKESFAEMEKSTNHIQITTLHERINMNLMKFSSILEYTHYKTNIHFINYTDTRPGCYLKVVFKHLCL